MKPDKLRWLLNYRIVTSVWHLQWNVRLLLNQITCLQLHYNKNYNANIFTSNFRNYSAIFSIFFSYRKVRLCEPWVYFEKLWMKRYLSLKENLTKNSIDEHLKQWFDWKELIFVENVTGSISVTIPEFHIAGKWSNSRSRKDDSMR